MYLFIWMLPVFIFHIHYVTFTWNHHVWIFAEKNDIINNTELLQCPWWCTSVFVVSPGKGFALHLIHDPISEQVTSCQGGDGWDMDVALCANSCLPCWRDSTHCGDLQVPSAPYPRKAYPSFTRQVPALEWQNNSSLRGPQEGLWDQTRLLRALSTLALAQINREFSPLNEAGFL